MMQSDDLSKYLPKYLSVENYQSLLDELKSFPENIDKRLYTTSLEKNILYQGDGYNSLPVVDMAHLELGCKNKYGIIVSNTCDIDITNKRPYPSRIVYSPIFSLEKFLNLLKDNNIREDKIENCLSDIRHQRVTSIFYLPAVYEVPESLVFLDRLYNIENNYIDRSSLTQHRLFSLSDYGFYLFLFKLSVHFSRIRERVNRGHL